MAAFKNIYNPKGVKSLSEQIKNVWSSFDQKAFEKSINKELGKLEMKARVQLISQNLKTYLPGNYPRALSLLVKTLQSEKNREGMDGFWVWPLTDFVETYGLEHFDESMAALKEMTKRFTAEFAVRPFLIKNDKKVFKLFDTWKDDENYHVRRLVSEGTRPNLPWGKKVESIHENPERGLKLIEQLAYDKSDYVRKSVANHINDISHFDSSLALDFLKKIDQAELQQQRLVKHASRTLLKKGNTKAFQINRYNPRVKHKIRDFKISPRRIKEGERLKFSFSLESLAHKKEKIQLAVRIFFPRLNGESSKKVFQLKEVLLEAKEVTDIVKEHHFKKVTTRKHYPGKYKVELLVNGKVSDSSSFHLSPQN